MAYNAVHVLVTPDFLGDILVQKNATYTRINTVKCIYSLLVLYKITIKGQICIHCSLSSMIMTYSWQD